MVAKSFHSRIILRCGFLLASLLVLSSHSAAQVHVEVNPRVGALDETFVFSVVVESSADTGNPVLAPSEDFGVSYIGPQSSVTIINGDVRKRLAFNYRLIPRHIGNLLTPPVDVDVGGVTVHSNSLEVQVTNEAPTPRPQKVSGVSLRQTIEPKSAFIGQQVDSTLELQTAVNLIEPQFVDLSFDGFWVETIADNERTSRIMSGDQYDILRFRKALYPLTPGTLIIPPRRLKAQVRDTRHNRPFPFDSFNPFDADILDNFFGGGAVKEISVDSNGVSVEVKELPQPPNNFPSGGSITPLVGETTVSVRVPAGDLKVGDTKTIEIIVTSTGNLNPLKSLPLRVPASVKTYDDAPTSKNFESGGVLMSRKIFRISLVPLQGGEIRIPPIELGYFDTSQESYRIAASQEIVLSVEGSSAALPSAASDNVQASTSAQTNATVSPAAIAAATPNIPRYQEESLFEKFNSRVSTSMLLLIIVALCLLFALGKSLVNIRRSGAPLRAGLAEIQIASNVADLSLAFRRYASMKLSLNAADLRGEQFRVVAERQIADKNIRFALQSILDAFDAALYAPDSQGSLPELKERALTMARSL